MDINEALKLAVKLHDDGQVEEAARYYTAILKVQPKHPDANHNMGVLAVTLGKVQEALPFFKSAIEANTNITQFWLSYIDILIELERFPDAKAIFDIAKSYGANGEVFDKRGEGLVSVEKTKNVNLKIQNPPQKQLQFIVNLYKQNKLQQTLTKTSELIRQFPSSITLHNISGAANAGLKQYKEAVESYRKAININPNYAEAHNNMGNALHDQGELEKAIEAYNSAISLNPHYADAYYNLGITLQDQGKLEMALSAYTKALEIKPDYFSVYNNMGNVFKVQGEKHKAIEAYKKAININPNYVEAKTNLAILLYDGRQYEEAANLFSLNDTALNQSYLLKCLYKLDEKSKFFNQLDLLTAKGVSNAVIGSFIYQSENRYGIKKPNPFCNNPFKYILKKDLTKECDFKNIFVQGAADILKNEIIQRKVQGHLTNGVQTAGNVFTQMGPESVQIQNIIYSELEKYHDHFKKSEEGIIKNWPTDYSIFGWLVSMKSGGELKPHIHDDGWVTGSIYINVPPKVEIDSGNLVLSLTDEKTRQNEVSNVRSIDVVTGSLCLFPSSLLHYTIPFQADEDRIVLAFDMIPNA